MLIIKNFIVRLVPVGCGSSDTLMSKINEMYNYVVVIVYACSCVYDRQLDVAIFNFNVTICVS